jgi:hypothetical protein
MKTWGLESWVKRVVREESNRPNDWDTVMKWWAIVVFV